MREGRLSRICIFPRACAYPRCGCYLASGKGHDYTRDVGNLHMIDWILFRATQMLASPVNWPSSNEGRYLDGEEEREGTYR